MNRYDGPDGNDPSQPYLAAYKQWESLVDQRFRVEAEIAGRYMELLNKYMEKCAESDREKRIAMMWEKEHRMAEQELDRLKTAAVCTPRLRPTLSSSRLGPVLTRTPPGIITFRFCYHRRRWRRFPRRPYCQGRRGR